MEDSENEKSKFNSEKIWKSIYLLGGIAGITAIICFLTDLTARIITNGNLSTLTQTAADRFIQFRDSELKALYCLDFFYVITQFLLVPFWYALYSVHRFKGKPVALLALIIFLLGTAVVVSNNAALPMLELSKKYNLAQTEEEKVIYSAAGEALLARGGSAGVFLGLLIPNLAGLIMSFAMLKAEIFSRAISLTGIFGFALMIIYVISITFVAGMEKMATAFVSPAGLLLIAWTLLISIRFIRISISPLT
jgi:hypothetical protein